MKIERPDTNSRRAIMVVFDFVPTGPRSALTRTLEGSKGTDRVTFVLATPGKEAFRTAFDPNHFLQTGESLLFMQKDLHLKVTLANQQEAIEVLFSPNAEGALASAQMRVKAADFREAECFAFDCVMPILSWWSYRYDIALDITGYHVVEEQTESTKWVVGLVGKAKALADSGFLSKPEYRTILSSS